VADDGWRALIIGYGNPLRGDDGLGWHAAHLLEPLGQPGSVQILARQQLTPELAAPIAEANRVIFVDAGNCADSVTRAGQVNCQPVVPDLAASYSMTHHLTPSALLACAHLLYNACPEAWLCSVTSAAFDIGEQMSPAVQEALPTLLERIQQLLTRKEQ
jgi:hydrogenase maturation protease